jgi:hypothetical protein
MFRMEFGWIQTHSGSRSSIPLPGIEMTPFYLSLCHKQNKKDMVGKLVKLVGRGEAWESVGCLGGTLVGVKMHGNWFGGVGL